MDQFVYQMYACGLFEAKLLDDWEESTENLWGATPPQFTKQYPKERRKLEREQAHKNFESRATFQEAPHNHTLDTHHGGATVTTAGNSFTTAMEYDAALEEKANAQAESIIESEASVDGQTVLTEATYFVSSAVSTEGANKELKKIRAMMKRLKASITSQAATLEALSTNMNSNGRGSGQNVNKKKARPDLHVCAY